MRKRMLNNATSSGVAAKSIGLAAVAALMLTACGGTDEANGQNDGQGSEPGDTYTVGMSWSALQTEYFNGLKEAVDSAASDVEGLEVIHVDANDDVVTQLDQINDLTVQKPDVIVVNAVDSEAVADTVLKIAEDFPVFTLDRQVAGAEGAVVTHVGASAEEAGYHMAQIVCEEVGPEAKFLGIWGLPGLEVVQARVAGVKRGMTDGDCNLQMVDESYEQGEGTEDAAVRTGDWLERYSKGEVDAIITFADSQGLGALQELKARGREDIVVTGAANFGGFHDAICEGDPQALGTVDFNLQGQGEKLVETILEFRDGKTDFPEWVTTPQIVVTSENQETCN